MSSAKAKAAGPNLARSRKPISKDAEATSPQPAPLPLKIVIRKLPATIPEHIFWASVDQIGVTDWDWRLFKQGKESRTRGKEGRASRAYIRFKTVEAVVEFANAYNGHIFKDSKGHTSEAQVEFAPYQVIGTVPIKPDPRQGTIEQDTQYLAFVEALASKAEPKAEVPTPMPAAEKGKPKLVITPLVEHLQAKKERKAEKQQLNAQASSSKAASAPTKNVSSGPKTTQKQSSQAKTDANANKTGNPVKSSKNKQPLDTTAQPAVKSKAPRSGTASGTAPSATKSNPPSRTASTTEQQPASHKSKAQKRNASVVAPKTDKAVPQTDSTVIFPPISSSMQTSRPADPPAKNESPESEQIPPRKRINTSNRLFGQALGGAGQRGRGRGRGSAPEHRHE